MQEAYNLPSSGRANPESSSSPMQMPLMAPFWQVLPACLTAASLLSTETPVVARPFLFNELCRGSRAQCPAACRSRMPAQNWKLLCNQQVPAWQLHIFVLFANNAFDPCV